MKALILTNGDYGEYNFCTEGLLYDMIICADNGMKHARKLNILPHSIVGDLDSCNEDDLSYFEAKGVEIIKVPAEKDETDTELAIERARARGATSVAVYGGVGSRMDHSIANIQLIYRYLRQGIDVTLYSAKNTIRVIESSVELTGRPNDLVSLMPFTERVTGVYTKGLAYEIKDGTFQLGDAYGVSNYLIDNSAQITIGSGVLLVIQARD